MRASALDRWLPNKNRAALWLPPNPNPFRYPPFRALSKTLKTTMMLLSLDAKLDLVCRKIGLTPRGQTRVPA